ncbi:DUF1015 family protein [Saccharopolyspora taberi]|uniref:DUF1015 family protein n=1 Tax=Saccharopolyspora taberi TaxID=60895 RepID=A0ABN3VD24_9PSEU
MSALPLRRGAPPESHGVTARAPRALVRTGPDGHVPLPGNATVVYRLETGQHRQTGLVVEVAVDDYRHGRILRHEATRPDHVHRLTELTEATGTEQLPVMLVHRGHDGLRDRLAAITAAPPDLRVTGNGVVHSVWIRAGSGEPHELSGIGTCYIADGHHRMSAAVRHADRWRHLGPGHPSAFTLAALFPSDEMRVLGHDRRFRLRESTSATDVLGRLASVATRIEPLDREETAPGSVAVSIRDRWYRVRVFCEHESAAVDDVLVPALHGLLEDEPGAEPTDLRFVPHPPTVERIMAISDAGLVMPPKSTWFDPKPLPGLFVRELR